MAPRRRNTKAQTKEINSITLDNLIFENALCPVCRSILIKPVSLPCGHHFCLVCFDGTVNNAALVCPLCRTRISSWLRSARKENKLVNDSLWNIIQQKFSHFVQNKLQGKEDYANDKITRVLATPGEISQEYQTQLENEKKIMLIEREEESKASEILIRKLQQEEIARAGLEAEKVQRDAELARQLAEEEANNSLNNSQVTPKSSKKKGPLDTFVTIGDIQKYGRISQYTLSFVSNRTGADASGSQSNVKCKPKITSTVSKVNLLTRNLHCPEKSPFPVGLAVRDRRQYLLDNCVAQMNEVLNLETDDIITKEITHIKPIKVVPLTPQKSSIDGRVISPLIRSEPIRPSPNFEYSSRIKSPTQQIISPDSDHSSAFIFATPNKYLSSSEFVESSPHKTSVVKKIQFDANDNEAFSELDSHILTCKTSPLGSPFTGFTPISVDECNKPQEALNDRFISFVNESNISSSDNVITDVPISNRVNIFDNNQVNELVTPVGGLAESEIILEQKRLEEAILQERRDLEYARKLHEELNHIETKTYELRTPNNRYVFNGRIEKKNNSIMRSRARKRQSTIDELCSRKKYKV